MDRDNSGLPVVVATIGASAVVLSAVIGAIGLIISTAIAAGPHQEPTPTPPTRGGDDSVFRTPEKRQPAPPDAQKPQVGSQDDGQVTPRDRPSPPDPPPAPNPAPPVAPRSPPPALIPAPPAPPPAAQVPAPPPAPFPPPPAALRRQVDEIKTPQPATLVTASGKKVKGVLLEVTETIVRFQYPNQVYNGGCYRFDRAGVKRIVTRDAEYVNDAADDRLARQ